MISLTYGQAGKIWQSSTKAENGDKEALEWLVNISGKKKKIKYMFGRHMYTNPMGELALFNLWQICFFDDTVANKLIHSKQVIQSNYFKSKIDSLTYSSECTCWYKTPFEKREIEFEYAPLLKNELDIHRKQLQYLDIDSVVQLRIDSLLEIQDPFVFVELTRYALSRRRSFYNTDYIKSYINTLIGAEIYVQNATGKINNHNEYDYHRVELFNYYSFWLQNHKAFQWNDSTQYFEAPSLQKRRITEMDIIIDQMNSKNDSLAMRAYRELINSNFKINFSYYNKPSVNRKALPIYWDSFLRQIRIINNYLKEENLKATLTKEQSDLTKRLLEDISYSERRSIENSLIKSLDPISITAFEIEMLCEQQNKNVQHSATRIFDIFYSKNWDLIWNNEQFILLFLKKAYCLNQISIVGVCNNYAYKLENCTKDELSRLKELAKSSGDFAIDKQIETIIKNQGKFKTKYKANSNPHYPNGFKNRKEMDSILSVFINQKLDTNGKYSSEYSRVLNRIPYKLKSQLIIDLDEKEFSNNYKYWERFCNNDLGLMIDCLDDSVCRLELKKNLKNLSELELYEHYLNKQEIFIRKSNGLLDYNVIYDILKYDITQSFTGSSSLQQHGVLSCIRVLEIEFDEIFGFKESGTTYEASNTANIINLAACWRDKLIEEKLVYDVTPISFVQGQNWIEIQQNSYNRKRKHFKVKRHFSRYRRKYKRWK